MTFGSDLEPIRYVTLTQYFKLAAMITGAPAIDLMTTGHPHLADSALHAPRGEYGGHRFYRDLADQAAVLVCHLTWNHPLAEGNKRAAWAALTRFIDSNPTRLMWRAFQPNPDQVVTLMVAVADHRMDVPAVAHWLRRRTFVVNECAVCERPIMWISDGWQVSSDSVAHPVTYDHQHLP